MLMNCAAYQDGRKLADIAPDEIGHYLEQPRCFVWVALFEPTPEELQQAERVFSLHPLAVEDAIHGHERPKLHEYGDALFVVMPIIELEGGELRVGQVAIFLGSNYVLSVRVGGKRGFMSVQRRCETEPDLLKHGPAFVLYALMDAVVDWYFPVVNELEFELEPIEEKIFRKDTVARSNIQALYGHKQKLMTLKHAVEPLIEVTGKLRGTRAPRMCAAMREYFRDVYDHLQRIHGTIEGIQDTGTTAIQVSLGMINLIETEVTKKLAGWAALIAVPTFITAIYGMNFKIPEYEFTYGYPLVLLAMVTIDVVLYFWFKRINWL